MTRMNFELVSNPNPSNNDCTLNFPHDIIIDILKKLAVKSLVRFKGVCKSWYSLIEDDKFIKQHYDTHRNCQKYFVASTGRWRYMINGSNLYHYTMDVPQVLDHSNSRASLVKPPFESLVQTSPFAEPPKIQYFSSNGILLIIYPADIIFLWNPATRESRRIPCPILRNSTGRMKLCGLYNFCYFPHIDSYKIFRLGPRVANGDMEIDVFSTRSNTWKSIGPFPPNYCHYIDGSIVMADGIAYIMAMRRENGDSVDTVVRFCLEKEQFQEELLLPYTTKTISTRSVLYSLGEKLCLNRMLVPYHDHSMCIHEYWLYTMKTNSWSKILTIPLYHKFYWLRPLSFMKNGDMMLHNRSGFMVYNSTTQKKEKVNVAGIEGECYFSRVVTYVETLSSPNS